MDRALLALSSSGTAPQDLKVYWRQTKTTISLNNTCNQDYFVEVMECQARKALSLTDVPVGTSILKANITAFADPYLFPMWTSNTFQRDFKIIKRKMIKLQAGGLSLYTANSKFSTPRAMSQDLELNTGYYSYSKYTRAIFIKVHAPLQRVQGGSGWVDASYALSIVYNTYMSFYILGNNDPNTVYVRNAALAPVTGTTYPQVIEDKILQPYTYTNAP